MGRRSFAVATVLIINNDIGFTFWLGQTLNEAGYATLPARGVSDAVELLSEHKVQPDLLIINPASPGVLDLIADLRRSQVRLKVIASIEGEEQAFNLLGVDRLLLKPVGADETVRVKWLETIEGLLGRDSAS
jgi:response regulator RpfG family c-di-GMP phosphodiesterase